MSDSHSGAYKDHSGQHFVDRQTRVANLEDHIPADGHNPCHGTFRASYLTQPAGLIEGTAQTFDMYEITSLKYGERNHVWSSKTPSFVTDGKITIKNEDTTATPKA